MPSTLLVTRTQIEFAQIRSVAECGNEFLELLVGQMFFLIW